MESQQLGHLLTAYLQASKPAAKQGGPLPSTPQRASMDQGSRPSQDDSAAADHFRMYVYKVVPCSKRGPHDWTSCPFCHPGEKAMRRCPSKFSYTAIACPDIKKVGECPRGQACPFAHNVFEYWLHPSRYRTQLCSYGADCKRPTCFFAHHYSELRIPDQQALLKLQELERELEQGDEGFGFGHKPMKSGCPKQRVQASEDTKSSPARSSDGNSGASTAQIQAHARAAQALALQMQQQMQQAQSQQQQSSSAASAAAALLGGSADSAIAHLAQLQRMQSSPGRPQSGSQQQQCSSQQQQQGGAASNQLLTAVLQMLTQQQAQQQAQQQGPTPSQLAAAVAALAEAGMQPVTPPLGQGLSPASTMLSPVNSFNAEDPASSAVRLLTEYMARSSGNGASGNGGGSSLQQQQSAAAQSLLQSVSSAPVPLLQSAGASGQLNGLLQPSHSVGGPNSSPTLTMLSQIQDLVTGRNPSGNGASQQAQQGAPSGSAGVAQLLQQLSSAGGVQPDTVAALMMALNGSGGGSASGVDATTQAALVGLLPSLVQQLGAGGQQQLQQQLQVALQQQQQAQAEAQQQQQAQAAMMQQLLSLHMQTQLQAMQMQAAAAAVQQSPMKQQGGGGNPLAPATPTSMPHHGGSNMTTPKATSGMAQHFTPNTADSASCIQSSTASDGMRSPTNSGHGGDDAQGLQHHPLLSQHAAFLQGLQGMPLHTQQQQAAAVAQQQQQQQGQRSIFSLPQHLQQHMGAHPPDSTDDCTHSELLMSPESGGGACVLHANGILGSLAQLVGPASAEREPSLRQQSSTSSVVGAGRGHGPASDASAASGGSSMGLPRASGGNALEGLEEQLRSLGVNGPTTDAGAK